MSQFDPSESVLDPSESGPLKYGVNARSPDTWAGRSTLLAWMVIVFVCGGVTGAGLAVQIMHRDMHGFLKHPEQVPKRIVSRLRRDLELDEAQTEKVQEIIRRHHATLERIRAQLHPQFDKELNQLENEMSAVLNEAQKERWLRRFRRMRDERFPAPPEESDKNRNAS